MELINILWNYLERILFGGTWNGTGTERVPIKNRVERNGTSSSSGLGGTERNEFHKNWNGVQHWERVLKMTKKSRKIGHYS